MSYAPQSYASVGVSNRLSFDEFKQWYSSQSLGEGAGSARDIVLNSAAVPPRKETIAETRRLTNFQVQSTLFYRWFGYLCSF